MKDTVEDLERQRNELYWQLGELGDFRRGTISVNYSPIFIPYSERND